MSLSTSEVNALYAQHLMGNYARTQVVLARAQGSHVWDTDGKRYLDLLPGLGVNGLGHCPPRVVEAIAKQSAQLLHCHNTYQWETQALLAKALTTRLSGVAGARAFFCNSGTEATEAGIKLARLYGKAHGGKYKLISVQNGFHGRTYGSLTATAQPSLQKGFDPLVPGFAAVPLNDIKALEAAFDDQTVGFMIEPVQGEGGIFIATREYLEAAAALCKKHGALLMYDEVQCGMGRTGDWFAYQTLKAPPPDIIWLAKALGGGFPIGAMLASGVVAQYLVPGSHGSTFGGHPVACAAGLAVVESIEKDNLIEHVRAVSQHLANLVDELRKKHAAKIKEVRQLGLMLGIDLNFPGKPVFQKCLEQGVLLNVTHDTTVRMLPAMNVTKDELSEGVNVLSKVLGEF